MEPLCHWGSRRRQQRAAAGGSEGCIVSWKRRGEPDSEARAGSDALQGWEEGSFL